MGYLFFTNSSEENPKTLLLDEVEKGKNYELVMTTRTGLYRYRNGDVIEVSGFHENCPVFKMKYRYEWRPENSMRHVEILK